MRNPHALLWLIVLALALGLGVWRLIEWLLSG